MFDGAEHKRKIRTNDRLYGTYQTEDAVQSDEGPDGYIMKKTRTEMMWGNETKEETAVEAWKGDYRKKSEGIGSRLVIEIDGRKLFWRSKVL